MSTDRRDFLKLSAAAGGAVGLGLARPDRAASAPLHRPGPTAARAQQPLRILILGGTNFIGPHQVEYAQSRGHEITLFNRGRTNPGLFPDVEKLVGDRATGALDALRGRTWDVVVDNSATDPRWVRGTA